MQALEAPQVAHNAEEYPAMTQSTTDIRIVPLPQSQDVLTDILRAGAQELLAKAIEAEVAAWIDEHSHLKDRPGASRSSATATSPSGRSRPASGPSLSSNRESVTADPPTHVRRSPRRSCPLTCGRRSAWRD
jgi:hypothetical protein